MYTLWYSQTLGVVLVARIHSDPNLIKLMVMCQGLILLMLTLRLLTTHNSQCVQTEFSNSMLETCSRLAEVEERLSALHVLARKSLMDIC